MDNSLVDYSLIEIEEGADEEENKEVQNYETSTIGTPNKAELEFRPRILTLANRKMTIIA